MRSQKEQRNRLNVKRSITEEVDFDNTEGLPNDWRLPRKLAALRQKLAQKAKQDPKFRFYSLYGGVMDPDTLLAAWRKVLRNNGAPGMDGVSIEQILKKEQGPELLLIKGVGPSIA
jgi:RNA-directed DNA polymerase